MNTVGCVFCQKFGNVSALNQHVRSYLDAHLTGRRTRGSDHHNLEIVQAFYNLTAKSQTEFVEATSTDRLAVLTEFAANITKHLKSDTEAAQWRKRDFYPRRAAWWARQITVVLDMYRATGRLPQLLSAHVKNVIDKSVAESLANVDDDEDDGDDDQELPAVVPKVAASRSQLLAASSAFLPAPPAPQNDLTMQYTGSQRGNTLGKDSSITNKLTRKWINNLSTIENETVEPKMHLRKRGNHTAGEGSSSRSTEYVTISDEEQDDVDDDRMTPTLQVPKRGKPTATARAVSSTLTGSRIASGTAVRSVSDSALASAKLHDLSDSEQDGMGPFVVLHVTGLTNTVQTIAIPFETSLERALALAVRFAPRVVRENNLPVRFVGHDGSDWAGDWPEWRWEQLMGLATVQKVELGLRLIMEE